ncbi:MAG: YggS family pyridoxal phosphate-dependent enzyme [Opitutaceae bacterium]
MSTLSETFVRGLPAIQARITAACRAAGRDPAGVRLLPVTKHHPADAVALAVAAGLAAVGENRVQEAVTKQAECAARGVAARWELIGHLQSNKAKLAARHFDRVQSVESTKLLDLLDREAAAANRVLPVLLQLNAGNDPAKFGAEPAEAPALLAHALTKRALRVEGLMTIAPLADDPAVAHRTFANLRSIRDQLVVRFGVALPELSMGMTGDLEAAVAEGSTIVRIGTALFGERTPHSAGT